MSEFIVKDFQFFIFFFLNFSMISMNERVWLTDSDELYLVRATSNLLSIVPTKLNTIAAKNR